MRITSSFKDYYDYALAWTDEDSTLTYKRETIWLSPPAHPYAKYLAGNTFLVGFCGKVYAGLMHHTEEGMQRLYGQDALLCIRAQIPKKTKMQGAYRWVLRSFEMLMNVPDNFLAELYQTHYAPVFCLSREYLGINPCLKELQFQHVLEGSQAFQAIEQFLFGVLVAPETPTIAVSNEDKIIKHGFDTKWSFRKESTGKKGR